MPNEGSITLGTNSLTGRESICCHGIRNEAAWQTLTRLFERFSFYLEHLRCQRKLLPFSDSNNGRPDKWSVPSCVNIWVESSHPCANSPLSFNNPASSKLSTVFNIGAASLPNVLPITFLLNSGASFSVIMGSFNACLTSRG